MHVTISRTETSNLATRLYYFRCALDRDVSLITKDTSGEAIRKILGPTCTGRLSAQIKQALIQGAI